jgi:hypothetical protein
MRGPSGRAATSLTRGHHWLTVCPPNRPPGAAARVRSVRAKWWFHQDSAGPGLVWFAAGRGLLGPPPRRGVRAESRPGSGSFGVQRAGGSCKVRGGCRSVVPHTVVSHRVLRGPSSFGRGRCALGTPAVVLLPRPSKARTPAACSTGTAACSAWSALSVLSARQNSAIAAPR